MAVLLATVALASVGTAPASAGWLAPTDLAAANALNKDVGAPSIAVARDGTAFAAFQHFDGTNLRAAVVMRSPGGGFGAVTDLSAAGQDALGPVVAVDRQGNATIAWQFGTTSIIQARFRPVGGDWGAVQTISGGSASSPYVATGDNGAAVVVWRRGPTPSSVEAAIRASGAQTFAASAAISPSPVASEDICGQPRAAMDAAGDIAAIWARRTRVTLAPDTYRYLVGSNVKAAAQGAFAGPELRSTEAAGDSPCSSDIQTTPGGRFTAMWDFYDTVNPKYVEFAERSAPFAAPWSAAAKLSTLTDVSGSPLFAVGDGGDAAATWLAGGQILSAVRPSGFGFSLPKPLSGATDTKGRAVAASPNGDAMAVFVGMSNGNDAVFSARRRTGTEFGEVTPVAVTPPGGASVFLDSPHIALDDQGNAFAVWRRDASNGGGPVTAQVALFDPVPPVITAADVPATGTAGQAVAMSGAATDRMSGAALHFDFGDGSGADGGGVQHIYGVAGAYTVTITATDGAGNKSTATRAIQIVPAPVAGTGGPQGPLRVAAVTALSWDRLSNGRTRLRSLVVDRLVGPEKVRLTCTGRRKGCRKGATRTIKKHGRTLSLTKYVKGMTLQPKAQLTITVSRPAYISRIFQYTMVDHRDPKKATRCLAPGQRKSQAC
ncbi:MAG TPA: PKD domain-containing protein [Solirubrobacteraceae bacterium]